MRYDIIVSGFRSKRAKMVAAHQLAREESLPLHRAKAVLGRLPVTLFRNLEEGEMAERIRWYRKLGVELEAVEAWPCLPERKAKGRMPLIPAHGAGSTRMLHRISEAEGQHSPEDVSDAEYFSVKQGMYEGVSRWRAFLIIASFTAALAAVALVILVIPRVKAIYHQPPSAASHAAGKRVEDGAGQSVEVLARQAVVQGTPAARRESMAYADSGSARRADIAGAIRFFKLAIGFNRYNIYAWYGLLDSYRSIGRTGDARTTEEAMRELFGPAGFSADRIVRPFGILFECRTDADGVMHIEYRAGSGATGDRLVRELYTIVRSLRTVCKCRALSVVAAAGDSGGLAAYYSLDDEFSSLDGFCAVARFSSVER